jgi:DNA-binding transcriptional ArsR family regulator
MELIRSMYEITPDKNLLIGRDEGERIKELVCQQLKWLNSPGVLRVSFARTQFVDISGADEAVVKVLARLEAGEYPDRFLVLSALSAQHRENIEMALTVANRAVVVDLGTRGWTILGELNSGLRKVLAFIAEKRGATARELVEKLGIEPVNTASTRLVQLYEAGLVAREPYREPVRGGGRQFRYLPLVDGTFIEHGGWRSERTTVP